jgi:hypothetical protein
VPFPVGAADDDSWDSAEDDHAETRRRTWGKRGKKGFFLGCSKTDVLFRFLIFYFFIIIWAF